MFNLCIPFPEARSRYVQLCTIIIDSHLVNNRRGLQKARPAWKVTSSYVQFLQDHKDSHLVNTSLVQSPEVSAFEK